MPVRGGGQLVWRTSTGEVLGQGCGHACCVHDRCLGSSVQKTAASAVAVLTLGSMSLLCRSSIGSLLEEVPQIQFIARVCGPSSMHRDWGLSAGFGGDVGLGLFPAPPGRPGVERHFSELLAPANQS